MDAALALVDSVVAKYDDELVELRRDLHRHPEVSWQEQRTSDRVVEQLERSGWRISRMPRSGVIAFLRALTLSVWLVSLVINYWWRSQWNWAEDFYEQEVNIRSHYLVGLLVVLVAHLTLGIPAWFNAPFRALSIRSRQTSQPVDTPAPPRHRWCVP